MKDMKAKDLSTLKKIIDQNPEWVHAFNTYQPTGKSKLSALSPMPKDIPHRCPVCHGSGLVPNGFYNQTSGQWSTTSASPDQCRSCNGKGIVWS